MSASPTQTNERAARRLATGIAYSLNRSCIGSPKSVQCRDCRLVTDGASLVLRAVLRRSSDVNMREFCRAALKELGGK